MSYLPDVNVEQTPQNDDNVVINRGRRTIQMPYFDFIAGISGVTFPTVINSVSGSYTIVPDSTQPITVILMDGVSTVTFPTSGYTTGAIFIVTNEDSTDADVAITATNIPNITASSQISTGGDGFGAGYGIFIATSSTTLIAFGSITEAP